jgi:RimJ/RimL family protein N-acetyltransferase
VSPAAGQRAGAALPAGPRRSLARSPAETDAGPSSPASSSPAGARSIARSASSTGSSNTADKYDERECRTAEEHWHEHGFGHWVLLERKTGASVGSAEVHFAYPGVEGISTEEIEVGIEILPHYQRQGYANEAVKAGLRTSGERTRADHVVAYTRRDHAVSINLMETVGLPLQELRQGRRRRARHRLHAVPKRLTR